jgi:putative chitinase
VVTKDQLHACMPYATAENIEKFAQPLGESMQRFEINTPARQACFMATIAHESGCLKYTLEIDPGHAYDVGSLAVALGNTPEDDGDGEKYKGRGLIQLTGTKNYQELSKYFGQPFIDRPELLEGPVWASMSAGWFWMRRSLNAYCDLPDSWTREVHTKKGIFTCDKFMYITYRVNGGFNHLEERQKYYQLAKAALNP